MPTFSLVHRTRPATPIDGKNPGLLLFHGRGADEIDLLGLAQSLDPKLYVVSARAPYPLPPGYSWMDLNS
ncbi:MAG: phospholipase, partial [Chloroflexota bacterium]